MIKVTGRTGSEIDANLIGDKKPVRVKIVARKCWQCKQRLVRREVDTSLKYEEAYPFACVNFCGPESLGRLLSF